jgi:hypothetical protein
MMAANQRQGTRMSGIEMKPFGNLQRSLFAFFDLLLIAFIYPVFASGSRLGAA